MISLLFISYISSTVTLLNSDQRLLIKQDLEIKNLRLLINLHKNKSLIEEAVYICRTRNRNYDQLERVCLLLKEKTDKDLLVNNLKSFSYLSKKLIIAIRKNDRYKSDVYSLYEKYKNMNERYLESGLAFTILNNLVVTVNKVKEIFKLYQRIFNSLNIIQLNESNSKTEKAKHKIDKLKSEIRNNEVEIEKIELTIKKIRLNNESIENLSKQKKMLSKVRIKKNFNLVVKNNELIQIKEDQLFNCQKRIEFCIDRINLIKNVLKEKSDKYIGIKKLIDRSKKIIKGNLEDIIEFLEIFRTNGIVRGLIFNHITRNYSKSLNYETLKNTCDELLNIYQDFK